MLKDNQNNGAKLKTKSNSLKSETDKLVIVSNQQFKSLEKLTHIPMEINKM